MGEKNYTAIVGKDILNYRIISLIGKGGMGAVYLAEHKNISNQKAAIKVINAEMVNDFTRKMLKDEAEHLAGLHHHNIVSFLDFHIDKEGNIFLIMEYVEGNRLDSYINDVNGLIVEDRICPLFEPILDGVGYAHKKGILHRDIKPANIIISNDGTPKILDFGIAQIMNKKVEEESTSLIMGTPSYMSPEQVKGEALDSRSDVYSLGVLLFQMLTGNAPYDTTTLTEHEINKKVVEEPLPRMRTYYKYVSDAVQNVVDKATAKNPDDRYQNCEEFKKALHSAVYPWKMKTWAKCAIAAAIVFLIAGGCYIWDYNRTKVKYFKDYAEVWGVPQGIGKLTSSEHRHMNRSYKFVSKKRKVIKVSHVNSFDNVIDDGESERNERPLDQEFTYTEKGKVSRVYVKDRSGKVLYVKSYNEKLNTVVFQYDDEHGTERTISNKTVGYGRILEEDFMTNKSGRISRLWVEYDKNGFVVSEKFAGLDNSPVCDENGIYGRTYLRDKKGRALEIHYIGFDGEPQPTKWGLGIKKFYYDDNDNWMRAEYYTIDGQPALDDDDGVAVYEIEYDEHSNLVYGFHKAADGNLMYPKKNNVAGVHYLYDDRGCITRIEYLGVDKHPLFVATGYAIIDNEYDANGYVSKMTYLDTEGHPVEASDGEASCTFINDNHGNIIESWSYDLEGMLCLTNQGYAGVKSTYDSVGNMKSKIYYGKDQKPCLTKDDIAGELYEYDDRNLLTSFTTLNKDLEPDYDIHHVAIRRVEYDKRGHLTKLSFYAPDGKTLCYDDDGTAGWNCSYDENGNQVELNFFDVGGNPHVPSGLHYAKVVYTYDENNNCTSKKFFDLQGKLTSVNGVAGYEYKLDRRGNILEEKPIGTDGSLALNMLIVKYKYDECNNVIEQALFDKKGAAKNNKNVHKYEYAYNTRNQMVEERHYSTDGKLTLSSEKWAIMKVEYNLRGLRNATHYYGINEKPCKIEEGWSSATFEYDAFGNVVKQCFFDVEGNPSDPKDMAPVGIAQYDLRGNMTFIAAQDSKGNYILYPKEKWAITRSEYDKRNNNTSISYFNEKDEPATCSDGYHKKTSKYDTHDRTIEEAYFGTNNQPTLYYNVHKFVYKYAQNSDNIVEYALYGIKGQPVNCDAGFQKMVITYNAEGTKPVTRKFYQANGSLLATQHWNGSDWVNSSTPPSSSDWKAQVIASNQDCPLDLGEELMHLTIQSIRATGDKECEVRFTVPYSQSQLSSEQLEAMKVAVQQFTNFIENQLNHIPYVTSILYDKNGIKLYTLRL